MLERARKRLRLTPGARTFVRTLKHLGFTTVIVSGGFTHFTDALRDELGLDPNDLSKPLEAAVTSAVSFAVGALVPLLVVLVASSSLPSSRGATPMPKARAISSESMMWR